MTINPTLENKLLYLLQSFVKPDWPLLLTLTGPCFTDHPVYHHLPFPHHWVFACVLKLCVHMCSVRCRIWVYMIWFVGRSLNFQPTLPSVAQLLSLRWRERPVLKLRWWDVFRFQGLELGGLLQVTCAQCRCFWCQIVFAFLVRFMCWRSVGGWV